MDITMCYGVGCSQKENCIRYTTKPDFIEMYFTETPINKDGTCDWFKNKGNNYPRL